MLVPKEELWPFMPKLPCWLPEEEVPVDWEEELVELEDIPIELKDEELDELNELVEAPEAPDAVIPFCWIRASMVEFPL